MKTTRAKMKLIAIKHSAYGGRTFEFNSEYDPSIPEDQSFCKATPSASAVFMVDNPAVEMELGKTYYFDIVPTE